MKYIDFIRSIMYLVVELAPLIIILIVLLALLSTIIIKIIRLVVKWFQWKITEKKYTGPFLILLSLLSFCLYQALRPRNIEFTQIAAGEICAPDELQVDNSWYEELVLVKNAPKNALEQNKIMIAYFDSIGLGINALSEMPEIGDYVMEFYKSTRATRRRFIARKPVRSINGNKTYLGDVWITRCKDNAAKLRVGVSRNIGREDNREYRQLGPATEITILLDECSPKWSRSEKEEIRDSIWAGYYMELQNKKFVKR